LEIDTSLTEMDDEKDPHLQKEAQRIARTLGNVQKKKPNPERLEEQRRIQLVNQTAAVVRLVNSHNPDLVMEQETVYLKDGRIPLKELMEKWRFTDPVWVDADLELHCLPDGYSDATFANCQLIKLKGKIL